MKKKDFSKFTIVALICMTFIALNLSGCGNRGDMWDTNYTYDRAIIGLPNGESIEIEIDQWRDYEDGEPIQIIAKNGTIYLTSSYNCTLIRDKK